jgi:hypothetical protein
MSPLPCSPFLQNFKTLKFLYDLIFHQIHLMNMYFHRKGHFLLYKKFKINCMNLCIPFNFFFKNVLWTFDTVSLQDSKCHLRNIFELF